MGEKSKNFDFTGWVTKNDIKCSDGRTIRRDAFKHCDGTIVPLVWNHMHNSVDNVLGNVVLENHPEGVRGYGYFNDNEEAQKAKAALLHGDITHLSICANRLKHVGSDVMHGMIREVSLVLSGANPGALIDTVIAHGEEIEDEAIIYTDEPLEVYHSYEEDEEGEETVEDVFNTLTHSQKDAVYAIIDAILEDEEIKHSDKEDENMPNTDDNKTVGDVFNTLSEEQKTAVYAIIGSIMKQQGVDEDEEEAMKHNLFDGGEEMYYGEEFLSHEDEMEILGEAKKNGSLKDTILAHADDYGITDIDYLFPDAKYVGDGEPEFIKREMDWVSKVMGKVKHTPFSRIKSIFADITEDEARAKGYIKGKRKKEEVFSLLKRSTTPTTVYKKQKFDRDDIVDITEFAVIPWVKKEMRMMLDEEIARAILIGDGRSSADDDKIPEDHIRPVWTDDELFTVNVVLTQAETSTEELKAKNFIKRIIKARKLYKGSGNPDLYTTEDMLTEMLLLEDSTGRPLYDTVEKLKTKLRVNDIISVQVMENMTRTVTIEGTAHKRLLDGILVNLADYNIGADKGGAVSMFDDFDIDYNQMKYLIETRCSGALTKPYSAIAIESEITTQSSQEPNPVG